MTVRPGVLPQLYRRRWDIEEVFDEFKNKFNQTKSWASSQSARSQHGQWMCLARNLMTLLLVRTEVDGAPNQKEAQRRAKRQAAAQTALAAPKPPPLPRHALEGAR